MGQKIGVALGWVLEEGIAAAFTVFLVGGAVAGLAVGAWLVVSSL